MEAKKVGKSEKGYFSRAQACRVEKQRQEEVQRLKQQVKDLKEENEKSRSPLRQRIEQLEAEVKNLRLDLRQQEVKHAAKIVQLKIVEDANTDLRKKLEKALVKPTEEK